MIDSDVLKGHEIFKLLTSKEMDQVSSVSATKKFQKDETIFKYDSASTHLFLLQKGTVYLRLPAKDKELSIVIAKVQEGEMFGLSHLLNTQRYTLEAKCAEETEVLSIEAKPFREILQANPNVGMFIISHVAQVYFGRYTKLMKNLQSVVGQLSITE